MIHQEIQSSTKGQHSITLQSVLEKLACRLTGLLSNNPDSKLDKASLLSELVRKIDHKYFDRKLGQNTDYQHLLKSICGFYSQKKQQQVKKLFLIEHNYKNKFVHIFQLVLDLAMSSNEKEVFVGEIIRMEEREKEILLTFFDEVMKRNFIQKQSEMYDSLLDIKEQQYQELRQNYEQLYHSFSQLQENHNSMKLMNERLQKQNNQLLKDKQDLMNELGLEGRHTFMDIAEKFHNDIREYEMFIERISREIESKNKMLKIKDEQIQEMSASLSNWRESSVEQQNLIAKNKQLQKYATSLLEKQSKAKQQLDNNETLIFALKKQIEQKDFLIMDLSRIRDKYNRVKDTHHNFKGQFQAKTRFEGR